MQLAKPEGSRQVLTPDAIEKQHVRLTAQDRAIFMVMHELLPYTAERFWHRIGLRNPIQETREDDRPTYRHEAQPHNRQQQVWLQRRAGGRLVGLWLQEEEIVGVDPGGEKYTTLAVDDPFQPVLKVSTTSRGGVAFPNESESLFTLGQHVQVRTDVLDTLRLFNEGEAEGIVNRVTEGIKSEIVYDHMDFEL
jgi:hypothetical protein